MEEKDLIASAHVLFDEGLARAAIIVIKRYADNLCFDFFGHVFKLSQKSRGAAPVKVSAPLKNCEL